MQPAPRPDVRALDVLVLHWNRPDDCRRTLDALRHQNVPVRYTVVDNGSPAEALTRLRRAAGPDVHFLTLGENAGFGRGMNAGLKWWLAEGAGEWVVTVPHDAIPEPDCLERIGRAVAERPRAGIASAEFGEPRKPGYHWFKGPVEVPCDRGEGWESVAFPNGTLMALRRAFLEQVGLFDERFFAYTEEYELALRARRAGWEVGIVWGAVVRNPIRAAGTDLTWYLLIRNQLLALSETGGTAIAGARSVQMIASAWLRRARGATDEAAAVRGRAVRDFWAGRFGPPPADLLPPQSEGRPR